MNTILKLTAAAAALAGLSACDQLGFGGRTDSGNNVSANASAGNMSAPTNASAGTDDGKDPAASPGNVSTASTGTAQLSREFLIGRWTDTGDCNTTITFSDDGSFTVPGGGTGLWALDGDRLTFTGQAGTRSARVQTPNADTIVLLNEDGSLGRSTRCPG